VLVYRLANPRWIKNLSGSGRAARWNREGEKMIYTSSSLALGLLEMLVHLTPNQIPDYYWVSTEVPEAKMRLVEEIPEDLAGLGSAWLREPGASVALRVPSVIVPEVNVLLNPIHSDFADLIWSQPKRLDIDPRLTRK
jgi:RES domain-containing protein